MRINSKRYVYLLISLLVSGLILVSEAEAHNPDQSYIYIRVYESSLSGRFEATLKDLNKVLDLDLKPGSSIEDIEPDLEKIEAYALSKTGFSSDLGDHKIEFEKPSILPQGALGDFLQLNFKLENTEKVPKELEIDYRMFFDEDPVHRTLVVIEYNWRDGIYGNESIHSLVMGPDSTRQKLKLSLGSSIFQGFVAMIRLGIWHIWIGLDHILFLMALALPSVLVLAPEVRDNNRNIYLGSWMPAAKFRPALIKIVKIVTSFTIAHTITLSLAALNIFNLPSRFVEVIIALSIALAAFHNIWPVGLKREWLIAFFFGLFHGFGFAGVLAEKGFGGEFMVLTLLGFNLGVEVGQLVIISAIFPVLFLIRNFRVYSAILLFGSLFLIFASFYWVIERAFEIDLPLGGFIIESLGLG